MRSGLFSRLFGPREHFSEETLREAEEVRRMIASGYDPSQDPESPHYRSENAKPAGIDYGRATKYRLVERPAYLRGREKMAERGADLADLDNIILILLCGGRLPRGANPRKLRGDMKGFLECHIGGKSSNWVLVYRYDEKDLVLYAVNTGNHKECRVDRCVWMKAEAGRARPAPHPSFLFPSVRMRTVFPELSMKRLRPVQIRPRCG